MPRLAVLLVCFRFLQTVKGVRVPWLCKWDGFKEGWGAESSAISFLFPSPVLISCVRKRGVAAFLMIFLDSGAVVQKERETFGRGILGGGSRPQKSTTGFCMSRRALTFRILFPCVKVLGWHRACELGTKAGGKREGRACNWETGNNGKCGRIIWGCRWLSVFR